MLLDGGVTRCDPYVIVLGLLSFKVNVKIDPVADPPKKSPYDPLGTPFAAVLRIADVKSSVLRPSKQKFTSEPISGIVTGALHLLVDGS